MLELTKTPHTDGTVSVQVTVPQDLLPLVERALQEAMEPTYGIEEMFPDLGPGDALAGARTMRGLTQRQLAELVGCLNTNISEMERGKRTIGLDMAKRLGKALDFSYKTFL